MNIVIVGAGNVGRALGVCAGVTGSRDSLTSQPGVAPPVPNTCPSAEDHSDACASRSCSPPVLVQRGNPPGRLAKQLVITPVASHLTLRMFLASQLPLDYAPFSTSNANETSTAYSCHPARSIFSNAPNFRCSTIAALVRSP